MGKSGTTRWSGKHQHFGFLSKRYSAVTISSNKTFGNGDAGAYLLSGSAVVTGTLPAVSKCVGSEFIMGVGSEHAHVLTASADDAGQSVFTVTGSEAEADASGTKMVLSNTLKDSVVLKSDGFNFLVLGHKGLLDVSGG